MAVPEPTGAPQLFIGPLRIWVLGRQFPKLHSYWDGNWLEIDARCATATGEGRVVGSILHLSDLQRWRRQLVELPSAREGEALLGSLEPGLTASVTLGSVGSGVLTVELRTWSVETNGWVYQSWTASIEEPELAGWITAVERVMVTYPIRGKP